MDDLNFIIIQKQCNFESEMEHKQVEYYANLRLSYYVISKWISAVVDKSCLNYNLKNSYILFLVHSIHSNSHASNLCTTGSKLVSMHVKSVRAVN